jgi:hypothetical protein
MGQVDERPELDDRQLAILQFEQRFPQQSGEKDQAIRLELGLSAARYYQLLNALIDSPAAIVHDPMLVRRLHRVREARMSARAASADSTAGTGRIMPDRANNEK